MTDRAVADPLSLTGRWTFSRTIDDRLTSTRSTVSGHIELTAEDDAKIRWHESGVLRTDGKELPVYRTLWVVRRDGRWAVTFEDGRFFHPWTTGEQVEHPCGADVYLGRIDVEQDASSGTVPRWTVQWTVSGPAKDYTMNTVLTP